MELLGWAARSRCCSGREDSAAVWTCLMLHVMFLLPPLSSTPMSSPGGQKEKGSGWEGPILDCWKLV